MYFITGTIVAFFVAFRSIDDEEELLYGVTSIPRTVAFVKKPEERAPGK